MWRYLRQLIKYFLPKKLKLFLIRIKMLIKGITPISRRECNICGYKGYMQCYGRPLRLDAMCPKCNSLERSRLLLLAIDRKLIGNFADSASNILHFAPEVALENIFRVRYENYLTADLFFDADLKINIENIELEDSSFDIIIVNHVFEHVNDIKAATELARILTERGVLICQVPIVEGWKETYENVSATSERERLIHHGQSDHLRLYGADFRKRICKGGFRLLQEITAENADVIRYGLNRGEKTFVFEKI